MKITKLIENLKSILDKHGDLDVTCEPATTEILLDKHFHWEYYNTQNTTITNVELIDDLGCEYLKLDDERNSTIPHKHVLVSIKKNVYNRGDSKNEQ